MSDELHVGQPFPRSVGRDMLMLASVSLVLDMCVSSGAGCTAGSAGQSVELADLLVEGARGHDPAQDADACGHRTGGVPKLGFGIGGGRDDHLCDNVGVVGGT